ncbi:hypothetical protein [Mucilaginibacter gilvus]|uniref:Uncharacterized protein n=1 Tax=Mucilaginibacter gilvus TaxID=2305909 RepID=A0A444MLB3_9SPHI|nr:hypothetical protein [Mucilaginibacter gilvus]RWY50085.1 hypothetical protein EPL05_15095 [Mucilaginibacter gilvus]
MDLTQRALIGAITEDDARKMVTAYDSIGNKVTRAVWFGLEQLDQMVTLVKSESMLGSGADGIRIYFAQYTKDTLNGMPAEYEGKNTVIFVSTRAVARTPTEEDPSKTYHEDYFDGLKFPSFEERADAPIEIKVADPENRGELCQPRCQGVTLP